MLNQRIRTADAAPAEEDLQAIAKAAYSELLAELCNDQRSAPGEAEYHSASNLAFADYYQRLANLGGHTSLLEAEERRLAEQGWNEQRIGDLRTIIKLREDKGYTRLTDDLIDAKLRSLGYEPNDRLRWMVELALYPAFRDAHLDAEMDLRKRLGIGELVSPPVAPIAQLPPVPGPAPAEMSASTIPENWRDVTATQAAERLIASLPKFYAHRRQGKRAVAQVGEQTLRQIRWAAVLLERSMGGRPFWTTTQDDLKTLDQWFERLPATLGRAEWHREPNTTLESICRDAEDRIEEGKYEADVIGLQVGTTNKHYRKLGQIHEFMREQIGDVVPALKFSEFISADPKDERDGCAAYTVEQGKELFLLPPWTGCESVKERLEPGDTVIHDALFFVLLLVWYTGMRREEICKLLVDDIKEADGIWYIDIGFTKAGRVKTRTSVRFMSICDELIRLGFIDYVMAIRAAGHEAVFPELVSQRANAKKGDTFYKLWWIYLKPLLPSLKRGQAMHAARHTFETELKDLGVHQEHRDDALGHKGKGEGGSRYAKATRVQRLLELANQVPIVTDHLADCTRINLLPADQRRPRPTRRTAGARGS